MDRLDLIVKSIMSACANHTDASDRIRRLLLEEFELRDMEKDVVIKQLKRRLRDGNQEE